MTRAIVSFWGFDGLADRRVVVFRGADRPADVRFFAAVLLVVLATMALLRESVR
jgi:hypothetical protein